MSVSLYFVTPELISDHLSPNPHSLLQNQPQKTNNTNSYFFKGQRQRTIFVLNETVRQNINCSIHASIHSNKEKCYSFQACGSFVYYCEVVLLCGWQHSAVFRLKIDLRDIYVPRKKMLSDIFNLLVRFAFVVLSDVSPF